MQDIKLISHNIVDISCNNNDVLCCVMSIVLKKYLCVELIKCSALSDLVSGKVELNQCNMEPLAPHLLTSASRREH